MKAAIAPYRLQIFLPDAVREVLREVAYKERTSQQKLVLAWLVEKLQTYPEGRQLQTEDGDTYASPSRVGSSSP